MKRMVRVGLCGWFRGREEERERDNWLMFNAHPIMKNAEHKSNKPIKS